MSGMKETCPHIVCGTSGRAHLGGVELAEQEIELVDEALGDGGEARLLGGLLRLLVLPSSYLVLLVS